MPEEVHIQSNLPLIILTIILICVLILGYIEIKKLFIKIDSIHSKLDVLRNNIMGSSNISSQPNEQMLRKLHHDQHMAMMMEQQKRGQDHKYDDKEDKEGGEGKEEYSDDSRSEYSDDRSDYSRESSRNSEYDKDEIVSQEKENDVKDDNITSNTSVEDIPNNYEEDKDKGLNGSFIEEISDQEYKKGKYEYLSVNELKDKCKELQLPISGNKTKLIERLVNY